MIYLAISLEIRAGIATVNVETENGLRYIFSAPESLATELVVTSARWAIARKHRSIAELSHGP